MKRPFRRALCALVAVAATGAVTACDASPSAATVNGVQIRQTALNQELRDSSNPAYVQLVQAIAQQSTGSTVAFTGAGTGTFSADWTAVQLTNLIQAEIIHQEVVARHLVPGPPMLDAARAVLASELNPTGLAKIPSAFRETLVRRLAEHAELEHPGSLAAQLRQLYDHYRKNFFSQVCVRQITVAVTGSNGSVDYPASRSQADRIAASYNSSPSGRHGPPPAAPSVSGGSVNCYSQTDLLGTPASFMTTVMSVATGRATTPQRTGLGYNVLVVVSRTTLPFAGPVAQALFTAVLQRQPAADHVLLNLTRRAHVQVSPSLGTWQAGRNGVPGVRPPTPAANVPGAPSTSVPVYNPFPGKSPA